MTNLIRSFCEGGLKSLRGIPCKHYIPRDRECRLLKAGKTARFLKKCRASTIEMLYKDSLRYLGMFRRRHPGLPIDEGVDIDFGEITERLKNVKPYGHNLTAWRGYISKVAYNAVRNVLVKIGLLPGERKCGTCKYLPWSKPYICPKTGAERKKSDPTCEEYRWTAVIPEPITDEELIAEIITPEILLIENEEGPLLPLIINALDERIESAAQGSKNREKYERQYDIFVTLVHSLSDGVPRKEVIEHLAKKI